MKTLLLLRHAKSSWKDAALPDHDRPLNARGRRQAPCIGQMLREQDLLPGLILSSTAKRARKTAEKAAESSDYDGPVQFSEHLYGAAPADIVEVLRGVSGDHERVLLVGHNPGLEQLLHTLTGAAGPMRTAALAHIRLPIEHWQDLSLQTAGELQQIWRPDES